MNHHSLSIFGNRYNREKSAAFPWEGVLTGSLLGGGLGTGLGASSSYASNRIALPLAGVLAGALMGGQLQSTARSAEKAEKLVKQQMRGATEEQVESAKEKNEILELVRKTNPDKYKEVQKVLKTKDDAPKYTKGKSIGRGALIGAAVASMAGLANMGSRSSLAEQRIPIELPLITSAAGAGLGGLLGALIPIKSPEERASEFIEEAENEEEKKASFPEKTRLDNMVPWWVLPIIGGGIGAIKYHDDDNLGVEKGALRGALSGLSAAGGMVLGGRAGSNLGGYGGVVSTTDVDKKLGLLGTGVLKTPLGKEIPVGPMSLIGGAGGAAVGQRVGEVGGAYFGNELGDAIASELLGLKSKEEEAEERGKALVEYLKTTEKSEEKKEKRLKKASFTKKADSNRLPAWLPLLLGSGLGAGLGAIKWRKDKELGAGLGAVRGALTGAGTTLGASLGTGAGIVAGGVTGTVGGGLAGMAGGGYGGFKLSDYLLSKVIESAEEKKEKKKNKK